MHARTHAYSQSYSYNDVAFTYIIQLLHLILLKSQLLFQEDTWRCGGYHALPVCVWVFPGVLWVPFIIQKYACNGDSKLTIGVSVSVHDFLFCLSLYWPCGGLVACPGCTIPLTQWQLGWALTPDTELDKAGKNHG